MDSVVGTEISGDREKRLAARQGDGGDIGPGGGVDREGGVAADQDSVDVGDHAVVNAGILRMDVGEIERRAGGAGQVGAGVTPLICGRKDASRSYGEGGG